MLLSDDHEVRLMGQEREHDQVSVGPVKAVARIWVVPWLRLGLPDEVHHLVLAFTWDARV